MELPDNFYDQLCNELIDFAKDFDDYGKLDSDETYKDFSCAIEVELRPAITDLDTNAQEYANSVTDNNELREMIVNAFKAGYNI